MGGGDRLDWIRAADGLAPVQIDRDAAGDGGQPRAELALRLEALRRPPRLQKRLLRRLLGQATVTEDLVGDGVNEAAVRAIDLPHGVRIALTKACTEVPFLHAPTLPAPVLAEGEIRSDSPARAIAP